MFRAVALAVPTARFVALDVDACDDVAEAFAVRSCPTVKLLRGGRAPAHVVASLEGGGPGGRQVLRGAREGRDTARLDRLHEFFDDLLASAAREVSARSHYAETAATGGELVARFGNAARGGGGARDRLVAAAADEPDNADDDDAPWSRNDNSSAWSMWTSDAKRDGNDDDDDDDDDQNGRGNDNGAAREQHLGRRRVAADWGRRRAPRARARAARAAARVAVGADELGSLAPFPTRDLGARFATLATRVERGAPPVDASLPFDVARHEAAQTAVARARCSARMKDDAAAHAARANSAPAPQARRARRRGARRVLRRRRRRRARRARKRARARGRARGAARRGRGRGRARRCRCSRRS